MTFADAAIAYQLISSGVSERTVSQHFGISRAHISRVIAQCLEFGKSAPYLNATKTGRPRKTSITTIKRAMVMRDNGMPLTGAARALGVDYESLRRAILAYDPNPSTDR